jgi:hypothetical protein
MLRNLLGLLLLAPMLLNGLWVVCDDVPTTAAAAPESHELSEEAANCVRVCILKHQTVNAGEMCFLLPGGSKTAVTTFDFGAAILTPEVQFPPAIDDATEFVAALPVLYSSPSLANHTPPPKA